MRILLAVSGGIDSMCMAHMALHGKLMSGHQFGIAHCNFCLRGEESDGDESMVKGWAEENGICIHLKKFDTGAYAAENGISIEMAARELRYSWFEGLCREEGYDAVAIAHNANDNVETFLLNLLRGTGGRGLRGMVNEGKLLRPLLNTSREEIEAYVSANNVPFREDRTNAETVYRRNKLRHQVLPVFKEINPSYLGAFERDMKHLRQENDIAEEYYATARAACVVEDGEKTCVNIPKLLSFNHWHYVLFRVLEPSGMSELILEQMIGLLEKPGATISGKRFHAPKAQVYIVRKHIVIEKR